MSYDAIIVGGGPGGASTALALARQGRQVAVVERHAFPRRKVCGEFISAVNLELLDRLGVGSDFRAAAGPEVKRLGLFARGAGIEARMPRASGNAYGRALGRDVLDGMLLAAAARAGAEVFQPWRATAISRDGGGTAVRIASRDEEQELRAPVVVAAHGSWEQGKLATNLPKTNRPSDFLGFKAHFRDAALPEDLMPLLAFPGGYGGMVWSDAGRLSLSCCVRRDALAAIRRGHPGASAARAVHAHILSSCPAAAAAIGGAALDGEWLASGPIRPGRRACYAADIFRAGNVAGESHPVIAEGISMALQSGWLLAGELAKHRRWDETARAEAGRGYTKAWRRQFSTRILAAAAVARLASAPGRAEFMRLFVSAFPASLSIGARLSGKTIAIPHVGEVRA